VKLFTEVDDNRESHIEAVPKLEALFATGRWPKETLLSLAEDSSNEEVHESRDQ
jgi:hypothetical protein